MPRFVSGLLFALASSVSALCQTTHLVDVGGPPGSFDTIQEAVDFAQDGDTVWVLHPALVTTDPDISAGFVLDGKGLTVAAKTGNEFSIMSSVVRNVPNGSSVVFQGLGINCRPVDSFPLQLWLQARVHGPNGSVPGLTISNCSGLVSLDLCCIYSPDAAGLAIHDAELVTLRRVSASGGYLPAPQKSYDGMEVLRSRVDAEGCLFTGGNGAAGPCTSGFTCSWCLPGGHGGDGAAVGQGGYVFASSCDFVGGLPGVCGVCWTCDGFYGNDARVEAGGVMIERNANSGGFNPTGTVQSLGDVPRELVIPASVGPDGQAEITALGAPNEVVYFLLSESGGLFGQGVDGRALMVGSPLPGGRRRLGTIGPDGSLHLAIELAPALATETRTRHVQLAFLSSTGTRLSNAAAVLQVGADQPILAETEVPRIVPGTPTPGDGRSWGAPHRNLDEAAALSLAHPGSRRTYWIIEGDFFALDVLHEPQFVASTIDPNTSLLGGFTGTEESADERDLTQHRTRLSGDLLGDDAFPFQNRTDNLASAFVVNADSAGGPQSTIIEGIDFSGFNNTPPLAFSVLRLSGESSIRSCRFTDNLIVGNALISTDATDFKNTEWIGNRGTLVASGFSSESLEIRDSLFVGNTATHNIVRAGSATRFVIEGVTAAGNRVDNASGGVFVQSPQGNGLPIRVRNSILFNNAAGGAVSEEASLRVDPGVAAPPDLGWSLIEGWSAGFVAPGMLNLDPGFVDPAGPDGILYTGDGDFRLRLDSACIDAGDNDAVIASGVTNDLDDGPRRIDQPGVPDTGNGVAPIVDLGCYER